MSPVAEHRPPIDSADFHRRAHQIGTARGKARDEATQQGLIEAQADHRYRKAKAVRILNHRTEGASWAVAEKLAEGDAPVADAKLERDTARVLRRSAEMRWAELERNAANLRKEADLSGGIE